MQQNISQDYYGKIYKKTIECSLPFLGEWELTQRCNLRCCHCYLGHKAQPELPFVKIKSILNELKEAGVLFLVFTGGEILLRDDFFDIARYSRKEGFALRLLTNATLIDDETVEKINSLDPLSIDISLYASTPSIHDRITGVSGSHELSVRAIGLLKKKGIKIVIETLFMKDNYLEFQRLKDFCANEGLEFKFDFNVTPCDDGSRHPLSFALDEETMEEVFLKNSISAIALKNNPLEELLCSAGTNNFFISSEGSVYPCIFLKETAGNLKELSFKEIWNAQGFQKIRSITPKNFSACRECGLMSYCNHCMGLAYLENGDIMGASSLDCRLARVLRNVSMKEKEGENEEKKETLREAGTHIREKD